MSNEKELAEHTPTAELDQPKESDQNIFAVAQHHSGPLPPPVLLSGYDQIVPGAAERLIQMAEKDQEYTHDISRSALSAHRWEVHVGQALAAATVFAAFGLAGYALHLGMETAAVGIGGATVVGLATAFIVGRSKSGPVKPEQP